MFHHSKLNDIYNVFIFQPIYRKEDRHNKLHHVITSYKKIQGDENTKEGIIPIHQDANIFVSEADPGFKQEFVVEKKRQAYLVCIEGSLIVSHNNADESIVVEARDALEVYTLFGNKKQSYKSHKSTYISFWLVQIVGNNNHAVTLDLQATEQEGTHFIVMEMAKAWYLRYHGLGQLF